jgi:predicted Zn-dependent protease
MKGKYLFLLSLLFFSCYKVPITGRKQLNMLPESSLMDMSLTNYQSFLNENKVVPTSASNTQMVQRVGEKIADAVKRYMNTNGHSKRIKNFTWEFNLVEDKSINAWCMPGGKVVVYTGLLPVSKTEEGLAVVMGHEIAHAIARHGNERMSQQLLVQAGGIGLSVALSEKPKLTQDLFLLSYGATSSLGVLGYSRKHESEADKIGLVFMAMAGYNPEKAVPFWQRMANNGGSKPPELVSTHPSNERRINDIQEFLPIAMTYYKK